MILYIYSFWAAKLPLFLHICKFFCIFLACKPQFLHISNMKKRRPLMGAPLDERS